MSSNGKSMVPGASKSEKPKGAAANSFPDTTKPIAAPSVSSDLSIGAPPPLSKKDKVDSSDSSSRLTKPSSKTGVASGVSIGRPNPKTSTGLNTKTARQCGSPKSTGSSVDYISCFEDCRTPS
ncbi:uncharacterized protein LOC108819339 isoform X1 [Raphanus sativus]|uniref:Uncharacterized protein LOC108819339 isoform X1 n=1 Tax=Raphanus sativus TaxID=3726 RepID=A0A9W3CD82_RAPSA|nr:uncharacterized protein LOC108819339 isoform X1 [Raphanus sativus]